MTDRPIIFSAPMVRALLDGRKTMTRRLAWRYQWEKDTGIGAAMNNAPAPDMVLHERPTIWQKIQPGDRLWVRESWGCPKADRPGVKNGRKPTPGDKIVYRANAADAAQWDRPGHPGLADFVWRPSIHMPRWASRLTLVVNAVRQERLKYITENDARCEGLEPHELREKYEADVQHPTDYLSARHAFSDLWDDLHGRGSWNANPEVMVLSFTVHPVNIDKMDQTAKIPPRATASRAFGSSGASE